MTETQLRTFVPMGSEVEHVTVAHSKVDATADVPVEALPYYQEKGWKPVKVDGDTADALKQQLVDAAKADTAATAAADEGTPTEGTSSDATTTRSRSQRSSADATA